MGYRIDYVERGETLAAVVKGKSSLAHAACIAQSIAEQAARQGVRRLLIDLRGLADRVGALGAMLLAPAAVERCRVAVLDVPGYDNYYAFSEHAARRRGGELRYFIHPADALDWLGERRA